ncbi:tRNA lysidine(34) synthetase [Actinobaculum suis]|uniref:tRNA lysidine(34) synthetase n=1 Tax=Actinobaculum suis TaxID=1657 RepID=UPI0008086D3C|nr:tRNA lysidine(34) synthetase TilS [Actinobaculum suis]OCA94576.1 tRNA(Ile)-lysidine synthetase [Actinobaculum suis]OCA94987.1 tRNA(Ile)-lysidine synthetase [Actinobaculum suis]
MAGPPPAFAQARRTLRRLLAETGLPAGTHLVVAVSGGSDSLALAHAALFVGRREGYPVSTITVDHGIRPESAAEATQVAHTMREWGASEARVAKIELSAAASSPEGSARTGRYRAIAAYAREIAGASWGASQGTSSSQGAASASARVAEASEIAGASQLPSTGLSASSFLPGVAVLLGHTMNDQAETVLLGLGRGSGARSLAGMAPAGPLPEHADLLALRPLLDITREDLQEALAAEGISWVDDPSNRPDGPWRSASGESLTRAAIRHQALPALRDVLGPGTLQALARTAKLLRRDSEYLESTAENIARRLAAGERGEYGVGELKQLPPALRSRVLRILAQWAGAQELTFAHTQALEALVTGPGGTRQTDLPGVKAVRSNNQLRFEGIK